MNQLVPDTVCGHNHLVFNFDSITGDCEPQRRSDWLE